MYLLSHRIPAGARFSAPVQTGPWVHPASCTMGNGYFPGVKSGRGVTLTPHPLLVPWSWNGRAIPLLPLWAVRPVQSLFNHLAACSFKLRSDLCSRTHSSNTITVFTVPNTSVTNYHNTQTWIWWNCIQTNVGRDLISNSAFPLNIQF